MKKILLSLMIMAVIGFTAKVQAQCTLNNIVVTVKGMPVLTGTNLAVTFDVSFDINANGGQKYIYIQTWKTSQWPNYWQCVNGEDTRSPRKAPLAADLVASFLRIGINNDVSSPTQPTILPTYGFDPSVTVTTVGGISKVYNAATIAGVVYDRFTLTDVQIVIPGILDINDPLFVTTDVFATQAAGSGPNTPVHCVNCGINQAFNDPIISGLKFCATPQLPARYSIKITTTDVNSKNITYKVYLDVNNNGVIDAGDELAYTSGTIAISAASPYDPQGPPSNLPLFSVLAPYSTLDIWTLYNYLIKVEGPTLGNGIVEAYNPISCSPLPVSFSSFTATRSKSNVMVKWETASEINNSGFAVERNINGTWEEVAFVRSQAQGGNSNNDLSYQYIDLNNTKGISQYRIKQVDFDNKSKYTEIRSVKGDGQIGKIIVYPNPTADGRVNVVFDDATVTRSIMVTDMSGRTIKQINGIANNNITIDNLQSGIYSLRVFVPETGEQTVQKIVVNKR